MEIVSKFAPESLQAIAWHDQLTRAHYGNFFYFPSWLTICIALNIPTHEPFFFWVNSANFLTVALLRHQFIQHAKKVPFKDSVPIKQKLIFTIALSALH